MRDPNLLDELMALAKTIKADGRPFDGEKWYTYVNGVQVAADLGGYAAEHPAFIAMGLRKHVVRSHVTKLPAYAEPQFGPTKGYCEVGIGAMEHMLGISRDEAEYVFGCDDMKILTMEGWEAIEGGIYPDVDYSLDAVTERLGRVIEGEFE